jgi:gamma-glutamyltranspeptidase/glutathione hydrolase
VATDEPRAALVARDVLSGGGSAVDAAIAGYFTLAVTLPSNAGIGGGGACLVHDAKTKKVEAILFMPQGIPGGQFGVPAAVRGMAYMQARYGRVPWATLVAPAENLALSGITVSRALAREIETAGNKLRSDPELARVFVAPDGHLLREGDGLTLELGLSSTIRSRGGGAQGGGSTASPRRPWRRPAPDPRDAAQRRARGGPAIPSTMARGRCSSRRQYLGGLVGASS